MKLRQANQGVSEILGMVILLAIAILFVSALYMNVLSNPGPPNNPEVTLVGQLDSGTIVFNHHWGEALNLDTQILFSIAGTTIGPFVIEDLIEEESTFDGVWNIGEQLTYDEINITDLQVEATVFEPESDQLLWWGVLQEGYIVPPHGRGGIWHFDEPIWTNTLDEVIDSSGNENHGKACNGAEIETTETKSNNSGFFDGIDDYIDVNVKYPYSLEITEAITVEAWVKPLHINSLIDYATLHERFGYTPMILHITGDIFAVVSEDYRKGPIIQTINITPDGQIEYTGNEIVFDKGTSHKSIRPRIIRVSDNIYGIIFINKNSKAQIETVNISSTGELELRDEYELSDSYSNPSPSDPHCPTIERVTDGLITIIYRDNSDQGIIRTLFIDSYGHINPNDRFVYDSNPCRDPYIMHVVNDIFILGYRNSFNNGVIKSFLITTNGEITPTGKELLFDDSHGHDPCIINVSANIFAVVYQGPLDYGMLKTFEIFDDGSIQYLGYEFTFASSGDCDNPHIIKYSDTRYYIAYSKGKNEGYFLAVEIDQNGIIKGISEQKKQFEEQKCFDPFLIKISPRILAVVYEGKEPGGGSGHPGELKSFLIAEDLTPPELRGIVKVGAVSLYADMHNVYGSINGPNQMIKLPISNQTWNHIAITYDRTQITLYCSNSGGTQKTTLSYTDAINKGENRLLFGNLFSGYIDEIAIYDLALTESEIINHFNNPGDL